MRGPEFKGSPPPTNDACTGLFPIVFILRDASIKDRTPAVSEAQI